MTPDDERIINEHADELIKGFDLADPEDVKRMGLRIEASCDAIAAAMADNLAHLLEAIRHQRSLNLKLDAAVVVWPRAYSALGIEPGADEQAAWERTRAELASVRDVLDAVSQALGDL